MRRLSRRQLRVRLVAFGVLSVGFMGVVAVAEQVVRTAGAPTFWTAIAGVLGVVGIVSLVRWQDAGELPQAEWQPSLLQRILGGALGFQAGLLGYFLAGDLTAASIGCLLFVAALVISWRMSATLEFEEADA